MGIGWPQERLPPHFPRPARGAGLRRRTHGACLAAEDTPLDGRGTEGQIGVAEARQVAAGREVRGEQAARGRAARIGAASDEDTSCRKRGPVVLGTVDADSCRPSDLNPARRLLSTNRRERGMPGGVLAEAAGGRTSSARAASPWEPLCGRLGLGAAVGVRVGAAQALCSAAADQQRAFPAHR